MRSAAILVHFCEFSKGANKTMKLVRSDSPEVAHSITATGAVACWGWSTLAVSCIASALGLLIALTVCLIVSTRAAFWIGMPVFIVLNLFLVWRGRSARLNWVVAGGADQMYIRLFVKRGWGKGDLNELDVLMLEASEIASISVRTVKVFLYGPKPKVVESLVIEPTQTVAEGYSNDFRSLPCSVGGLGCSTGLLDSGKQVVVDNEKGRLIMKWKWCRPILPVFIQQLERECPSVVIVPEERSELDLNGIWHGIRDDPDAQQRQMLVQAIRLGFGDDCAWLLGIYRCMGLREANLYLAKVVSEEDGAGGPSLTDAK
jgi:hypothetical protein